MICYRSYITTTHSHIYKIKKLIREYYGLEQGIFIHKPNELLKISNNPKVYISRKALKHFVERRKEELSEKYNKEITLSRMYFAISHIEITIQKYDSYTEEENKLIYSKYFETEYKSFIRVVTETIKNIKQIKSIHFKKNKKAT